MSTTTWKQLRGLLGRVRWFNLAILTITPAIGVYGSRTTPLRASTLLWSIAYYVISMLGYHRLWSHRSYNACRPLQYVLAIAGASAVQGSVYWWARGHRSHHRYTDTPLDPYNAQRGLLYSHIGWMLVKPKVKPGTADFSDLKNNDVVQWQHRWYFAIIVVAGYALPAVVPGLGWGDWWGGFCVCLFSPRSASTLLPTTSGTVPSTTGNQRGTTSYPVSPIGTDKSLSSSCLRTAAHEPPAALLTMGEGYHNFHHQFPMDYRNAVRWYQFDPTKWFIATCAALGLASQLHTFPENEINKGELTMKLKKLKKFQDAIRWPVQLADLPVVSWESFRREAKERPLVIVSGFVHDVGDFVNEHPGGRTLLLGHRGKDATAAFCGGVYEHSNAAHNLLAMMRVGVLHGGVEHVNVVSPGERLKIVERLN